ncbi:hypothetical protein [Herbidospora daliensis]|uniref:hypothetical protein n=1 Tax=Herbidospora daliensis TaxID=295585 RepID=UPI000A8C68DE|nr:hypothetical protein [Herbidospora daliensis]
MAMRSVLPVLALCTAGLAVVAYVHTFELVILRTYLDHPFAFGALACLLAMPTTFRLRRVWLRVAVIVLAALGLVVALFEGMIAVMFGAAEEAGHVDGPAPYRIRLQTSTAGLGPDQVTWLSLRREEGLLTREWHLGCFNDDESGDGFASVRWTGPAAIEIRVQDGRTFPITLDPSSGRPQTTAALNC